MCTEWRITLDAPIKTLHYFSPTVTCLLIRSFFPKGEKNKINKKNLQSIEISVM